MIAPSYTITLGAGDLSLLLQRTQKSAFDPFMVNGRSDHSDWNKVQDVNALKIAQDIYPDKITVTDDVIDFSGLVLPAHIVVAFPNATSVSLRDCDIHHASFDAAEHLKLQRVKMKTMNLGASVKDICLQNCKGLGAPEPHRIREIKGGYLSAALSHDPSPQKSEVLFYSTHSHRYYGHKFNGTADALLRRSETLVQSLDNDAAENYLLDVGSFIEKVRGKTLRP